MDAEPAVNKGGAACNATVMPVPVFSGSAGIETAMRPKRQAFEFGDVACKSRTDVVTFAPAAGNA
jgi:hypothetical protein